MQFGKDHKVDIKTLSKIEKEAYANFLTLESDRHRIAIEEAQAYEEFWSSAEERHIEDRKDIEALIGKVEKEILNDG